MLREQVFLDRIGKKYSTIMRIKEWPVSAKIALAIFGAGVGYLGLKDLEAVGMLWPFVACPERVRGKNDVFKIDNLAVLYGWYKGYVAKGLKSVHYLSGLMGTTVNVEHVDRVSDEIADLADELSRKTVSSSKSVDQ